MKHPLISLTMLLGLAMFSSVAGAMAPDGDGPVFNWQAKLRFMSMSPANKSSAFTTNNNDFGFSDGNRSGRAGGNNAADAVKFSKQTYPDADVSFFFSRHVSASLSVSYPQPHDVTISGNAAGSVHQMPICFTLKYHMPIHGTKFTPYLGGGINYTRITGVNLVDNGTPLGISKSNYGMVLQAGLDYQLTKNLFINLDYRHVNMNPNLSDLNTNAHLSDLQVSPDMISIGMGFKF